MSDESEKYRQEFYTFLGEIFESFSAEQKVSYSQLSLKAGFSSRNYLREVVTGKKMPREDSLKRILKALKAKPKAIQLCCALRTRAEGKKSFSTLQNQKLNKLRTDWESRKEEDEQEHTGLLFSKGQIPVVLASVGSDRVGSSLALICHRSGFTEQVVTSVLELLLNRKIVSVENGLYYMCNTHLIFDHLGGSDSFREFFLEGIERSKIQAKKKFSSKNHLFFQSHFTFKSKDLPKLRQNLRQVLIDFIEEHECEDGDSLAHLNLSLFDPKQD